MDSQKKKIGELLVQEGFVTSEQVAEALAVQKKKRDRIGKILIDLGYLTEEGFLEFLGAIPGTASVELSACGIEQDILDLVPPELARELELVPIGRIGRLLTVGMVCPLDAMGMQKLEEVTGCKVKPVLCSRSAVSGAIKRYYEGEQAEEEVDKEPAIDSSGMEGPLKLRRIAQLIDEIEELPTLPDVLTLISSVVNDPDSSAADLAGVIASDGALSAKLLKLANSVAYGFRREISSIQHAIAMLGFRETQSLAISVAVFDRLVDVKRFDFRSYWNHSLACATLARLLALRVESNREREDAFIAGLLHDMGKVVMAMTMVGKQERAASLQVSGCLTSLEAEEKVVGLTHAEVGYLLGERWRLPHILINSIRFHHLPELEPEPKGLASIIFLSDKFCDVRSPKKAVEEGFDARTTDTLQALEMPESAFIETLKAYSDVVSEITTF